MKGGCVLLQFAPCALDEDKQVVTIPGIGPAFEPHLVSMPQRKTEAFGGIDPACDHFQNRQIGKKRSAEDSTAPIRAMGFGAA
jgi:hypothetical protein